MWELIIFLFTVFYCHHYITICTNRELIIFLLFFTDHYIDYYGRASLSTQPMLDECNIKVMQMRC